MEWAGFWLGQAHRIGAERMWEAGVEVEDDREVQDRCRRCSRWGHVRLQRWLHW